MSALFAGVEENVLRPGKFGRAQVSNHEPAWGGRSALGRVDAEGATLASTPAAEGLEADETSRSMACAGRGLEGYGGRE